MTSILSAKHEPRDVAHLLRYPEEGLTLNSAMSRLARVIVWAPAMRPSSLLVILHYLLKNNSRDFNTGCCKNQLSESPDDPPKFAWGAWLKWEDRA